MILKVNFGFENIYINPVAVIIMWSSVKPSPHVWHFLRICIRKRSLEELHDQGILLKCWSSLDHLPWRLWRIFTEFYGSYGYISRVSSKILNDACIRGSELVWKFLKIIPYEVLVTKIDPWCASLHHKFIVDFKFTDANLTFRNIRDIGYLLSAVIYTRLLNLKVFWALVISDITS